MKSSFETCAILALLIAPVIGFSQTPTHEDFVKAARELGPPPAKSRRAKTPSAPVDVTTSITHLPGDRMVPLPPSALEAIRIENTWKNFEAKPLSGPDGLVVYRYGDGMPNVPCAVGQMTRINLQIGEKFDGQVPYTLGENDVWQVQAHTLIDEDGHEHPYLAIRPLRIGHNTTLNIYTNRHVYDISLWSSAQGYVSKVAFTYPEDEARKRRDKEEADRRAAEQAGLEQQAAALQAQQEQAVKLKAADTLSRPFTNTNYAVKPNRKAKNDAPWMIPEVVGDNGEHTKIVLPQSALFRNMPILQIEGVAGKDIPNFHYDNKTVTFWVDGLFTKADIVFGVGHRQAKVELINHGTLNGGK